MTTTAIRKVQVALQARLVTALAHNRVFLDRGLDDALEEVELPAVCIRVSDLQFAVSPENMGGATLNTASIGIDCYANNNPMLSLGQVNEETAATIIEAVRADPTLGGRLFSIEEDSLSPSDPTRVAVGCATLSIEALYFTPRGDQRTIVGQGGTHY